MKPLRILDHLKRKHADKVGKCTEYFKTLKRSFAVYNTAPSLVKKNTQTNDNELIRSYKIAEIIVKLGHAHTVAETAI